MEKWYTNIKKFTKAERAKLYNEEGEANILIEDHQKHSQSRFYMTMKEMG